MTSGWKLSETCRGRLLAQFPPRYARVVADHVTLVGGAEGRTAAAPEPVNEAAIVGRADDDAGVEAYVVRINGTTDRPDGSTWHVTWSLDPGREAKESNRVIATCPWAPLDPVPLDLVPATW